MAHVEVVVAVIVVEVRRLARVVASGRRLVRAGGVAVAASERVLRVERHAGVEAARQGHLQRVVAVVPAAASCSRSPQRDSARSDSARAVLGHDREFANDDGRVGRVDVRAHLT